MAEQKLSQEEAFRSSIQDVIAIAEKLAPFCKSIDGLISLARLALENDDQLHLLISLVSKKR